MVDDKLRWLLPSHHNHLCQSTSRRGLVLPLIEKGYQHLLEILVIPPLPPEPHHPCISSSVCSRDAKQMRKVETNGIFSILSVFGTSPQHQLGPQSSNWFKSPLIVAARPPSWLRSVSTVADYIDSCRRRWRATHLQCCTTRIYWNCCPPLAQSIKTLEFIPP